MSRKIVMAILFSGAMVSQAFAVGGTLVSRDGSPVLDRSGNGCETRYQATSLQQTNAPIAAAAHAGN